MAAKADKPETIAAKSTKEILSEIAGVQVTLRGSLSDIGEALIAKNTELSEIVNEIKEKQAVLRDLNEAEKALVSIDKLKEQTEDAKRKYKRDVEVLGLEYEDQQAEYARALKEAELWAKLELEDKKRAREQGLEDEDRKRGQEYADKTRELDLRQESLEEREEALGGIEEAIEEAVEEAKSKEAKSFGFKERAIKAEAETERRVLESQVVNLEEQVRKLEDALAESQRSEKLANDRAQAMAIAMADKESGKAALQKVEELAREAVKGNKK